MTAACTGITRCSTWAWTSTAPGWARLREPPFSAAASRRSCSSGRWVQLIPDGQWWTAAFNAEPAWTEVYCDITTEPRWLNPGEVTMVDLDLDVLRMRRDGLVQLVDEDEFAEHQVRYGYPAEVIRQAEESAAWLLATVRARTEPFGTGYRRWLDMVSADVDKTDVSAVPADGEPPTG